MTKKIISSIAGATVILSVIGVLSKGIGFIREIIYANNFGLSPEFDLYLTSSALPIMINISFIFICQHYFVPAYFKSKNESQAVADSFFNSAFWWFFIAGIFLAVLFYLFSGIIISFYMSSLPAAIQEQGLNIFNLFLITIPINAGMSIISAYLQAEFNFIAPSLANMIVNIVVIMLVIFFTQIFQIMILPLSFIAGFIIAFLYLYLRVRKKIKLLNSASLKINFKNGDLGVIVTLIFIELFSLSYVLIDRYFLGRVPEGGIAALSYAITIYTLPVSIFTLSLITPIFSRFSESSFKSGTKLIADLKSAIGINSFVIIPVSFILFFWGDSLISLFYQRGKFSWNDSQLTHIALQYYVISLVFYSAYLIIVKLFYSINDYMSVLVISIIAVILKILFNVVLVDSMHQNGLALSTSFIYFFLFFSGYYLALRKLNSNEKYIHINFILYFAVNGLTSFIITSVFTGIIHKNNAAGFIFEAAVFLIIYTFNSFLLKDNEPGLIKLTIFSLLGKRKTN